MADPSAVSSGTTSDGEPRAVRATTTHAFSTAVFYAEVVDTARRLQLPLAALMGALLSNDACDAILTLQFAVAWAGEGSCEPSRLGWWKTDLVDLDGGGSIFQRMLPRTHAWASLQAVREAARTIEARERASIAGGDRLRTLFHFGFDLDELLRDRVGQLKRKEVAPRDALPGLRVITSTFDHDRFGSWLAEDSTPTDFKIVPGGRELKIVAGESVDDLAKRFANALLQKGKDVSFPKSYPLPFVREPAR